MSILANLAENQSNRHCHRASRISCNRRQNRFFLTALSLVGCFFADLFYGWSGALLANMVGQSRTSASASSSFPMVQDLSCDPNSDDGKTHFLASQSPLQQILFIITGIIIIFIIIIIIIVINIFIIIIYITTPSP